VQSSTLTVMYYGKGYNLVRWQTVLGGSSSFQNRETGTFLSTKGLLVQEITSRNKNCKIFSLYWKRLHSYNTGSIFYTLSFPVATARRVWAVDWVACVNTMTEASPSGQRQLSHKIMTLTQFHGAQNSERLEISEND